MTKGASFHSHAVELILNKTPWYHFAIRQVNEENRFTKYKQNT